ncbi:MAG TPA: Gfo/Idh/MocA family oxidoreductase [Pseudonocardiaceae bacterium]
MRIGLAGTGRIGAFHADTLNRLDAVDSVVIADIDTARAEATAGKLGVEFVPGIDALFTSGLDGVVIAAATGAHQELIGRGVASGLPVFCEKPVAPDIPGTVAVLDTIGESSVQIGFQRRFDAGYASARSDLASGKLGWLHTIRANTFDPAPPPAEYIKTSGGFFRDCSVHDFDILRWVTGREVAEVYAIGSNRGAEFFREADDVDTMGAVLTLDDDSIALVSGTRYNAAGYDVRMELLGSADSVSVGLDQQLPLRSAEAGIGWPTGPAHPTFIERFRAAYETELRAFTQLVAGEIASPCTVRDALEAFYVAEACELSRREHRPVRVAEVRR